MGRKNRTLIAISFAGGVYAGVSALMAWGLTRSSRRKADETPAAVGLDYENVRFPSRDGRLFLRGSLIPPKMDFGSRDLSGHRWIVMAHGFGSHSSDPTTGMLGLARDLHDRGFGVFLFDFRASGNSQGARNSAGFFERLDLLGALDYLVHRGAERERIGVLGHSMGAAVALMACSGPATAAAIVADSAFADLWLMVRRAQRGLARPLRLANPGMDVMARIIHGIEIDEISPAKNLAISQAPVMIIHGADDRVVPVSHARILARAADYRHPDIEDASGELWIVPESGHLEAYRNFTTEYVDRVTRFFETHLKQAAQGAISIEESSTGVGS